MCVLVYMPGKALLCFDLCCIHQLKRYISTKTEKLQLQVFVFIRVELYIKMGVYCIINH